MASARIAFARSRRVVIGVLQLAGGGKTTIVAHWFLLVVDVRAAAHKLTSA
jgi:hypothetical protein